MAYETNLRSDIQEHLCRRIKAFEEGFRQNIAVLGPPGSGKSFQLQRLQMAVPGSVLVIYCPFYRESARSLLRRFLAALLDRAIPAPRPMDLEGLIEQAELRLPKTAHAARVAHEALNRGLMSEAFNRALDVIPVLIRELGRPCVLILDEFLLLEQTGLSHAFHELGKRVMTWPSVLFILSSSSPYKAQSILRERLHLLFGQFEIVQLGELNSKDLDIWMRQRTYGFEEHELLSDFMTHWLHAHPLHLNLVGQRITELAGLSRTRELSRHLLFEAVWDLLGAEHGRLQQWCESVLEPIGGERHRARATDVMIAIANGCKTLAQIAEQTGHSKLNLTLQVLSENDLVERRGGCWMVPDPVLRCWLATCLRLRRNEALPDDHEIRRVLYEYLDRLWQMWLEMRHRPLAEQVAALFARFDGDTIALDSKTGRLPRFTSIQTLDDSMQGPGAYVVADAENRRWCAAVQEGEVSEELIARFDSFCRNQKPRPTRKILVTRRGMDSNTRIMAKSVNMWVWESESLHILQTLYGQR